MSNPTHMAGNITSWVARHVINNLDGEKLNYDDVVVRYLCVHSLRTAKIETTRNG